MHLPDLPDVRASLAPEAPAIADDRTSMSNREFAAAVTDAAALLAGRGISRGDVVAIMLPNRVDFVVALFAAWRLGAAATPVNPSLTAKEIEFQIEDCSATAIVTCPELVLKTPLEIARITDLTEQPPAARVADGPAAVASDHLALLIYTSGTTGKPKGVMLDHANLTAMTSMSGQEFSLGSDTHSLLILPLFHVNGIVVGTLSPLVAGGRVTVAGRFEPSKFFDRVESARPTFFSGVPTIFAMLANLPDTVSPDTSSLQFAVCGAAPASAALLAAFESRFGVPVVEGYGLSEGTCASTVNPIAGPRKPGTVGRPLPGQSIRIVDGGGNTIDDGRSGEVLIKGANVMRGYLGRPDETAKALHEGWLRTGDIGHLDEDGYLILVDRVKDMIIRGGENIYPKEIENVVYELAGVFEAAVVGQPHDLRGEEPILFVSLTPGSALTESDIRTHIRLSLSKYKWPTDIVLIDDVPKNPVGKIDKPALRGRLAASSETTAAT
ncbi:AMP-dependent synthetase [Rhodococcus sp. 05-340-1]|uniref:class I adenylate-forming enzyme family protein n=1 Tax=unclassified Rhodococcus (in: high G+C Gram-positive bacteria) TaxID=192944 RepID=UPI000B9BFC1C|nr:MULTISPECIES: AMP-binding protein [unclassified Rhodococcus (in: high G+C Gram-positive bacteria)]OZD62129.1 AMP-dependent synthetase [Rhodococcus sp. 05-340-2]OZD78412.1 AMP-dependent synthetase [Rhodococcus sp. 05-340-1]